MRGGGYVHLLPGPHNNGNCRNTASVSVEMNARVTFCCPNSGARACARKRRCHPNHTLPGLCGCALARITCSPSLSELSCFVRGVSAFAMHLGVSKCPSCAESGLCQGASNSGIFVFAGQCRRIQKQGWAKNHPYGADGFSACVGGRVTCAAGVSSALLFTQA